MATKSAPFSMRLSKRMETLVEVEAKRTGRSKGAIVEALADEAMRMSSRGSLSAAWTGNGARG